MYPYTIKNTHCISHRPIQNSRLQITAEKLRIVQSWTHHDSWVVVIDSCRGLGLGHGSRVMRIAGQLNDGSCVSRVTQCDLTGHTMWPIVSSESTCVYAINVTFPFTRSGPAVLYGAAFVYSEWSVFGHVTTRSYGVVGKVQPWSALLLLVLNDEVPDMLRITSVWINRLSLGWTAGQDDLIAYHNAIEISSYFLPSCCDHPGDL